jgi:hypothetical protein
LRWRPLRGERFLAAGVGLAARGKQIDKLGAVFPREFADRLGVERDIAISLGRVRGAALFDRDG